jgi:hypothetical protein
MNGSGLDFFMYEAIKRVPASKGMQGLQPQAQTASIRLTKRYMLLHAESWLRKLGIYGHFVLQEKQEGTQKTTVWAFRMPDLDENIFEDAAES